MIGIIALMMAQASGAIVPPGEWVTQESTSAMDGKRSTIAVVGASTPIRDSIGNERSPALILNCDGKNLVAAVQWAGYLGQDQVWVEWRTDAEPKIYREAWGVPKGSLDMAFLYGRKSNEKLMAAIESGKQLIVRVSAYRGTQETTFDVSRSAKALTTIRAACPKT